ncbi:flagellar hook-basal body protein [Bacillus sp. JJ1764]|uniref:flagellar hook-basal body protein n=1 Tax=Bacillus sp. JJ1764 TaxID=3122964 RepID=UPI002FFFD813
MIRGLYSAASGMFSLERKQETLADNLANVQTPGYKKDDAVQRAFPKLLLQRINDFQNGNVGKVPGQKAQIGELANGVYTQERIPNFTQGTLVQTSQPLDVAIEDSGLPLQNVNGKLVKSSAFFTVQLANGSIGYTRNGKWDLDANGNLVTSEGYKILGSNNQPIQITDSFNKEDLSISNDGQVTLFGNDPAKTKVVGQIGVAMAQNPNDLKRIGGNVYQSDTPLQYVQTGVTNPGFSLQQGFMEQSNVDAGQTITDMMTTVRGYEANQKVIGVYDTSLQQLFSVGKING